MLSSISDHQSIAYTPAENTDVSFTVSQLAQFNALPGSGLSVTSWSPQVRQLSASQGFTARLAMLNQAMTQTTSDIFIAPEYYWNLNGDVLTPFSTAQKHALLERLSRLSQAQPNRLLIPGSTIWCDNNNKGLTYNSVFVLLNGGQLSTETGLDHYDKLDLDYERRTFPFLTWGEGSKAGFALRFNGHKLLIETCCDNGVDESHKATPAADVDLNLVLSNKIGTPYQNTKVGGTTVICDGEGWSRQIEKQPPRPKQDALMTLAREQLPLELRHTFIPKPRLKELLQQYPPK